MNATIRRTLAVAVLTGTVLAAAPVTVASADTGSCDPADYYRLEVALIDAQAEIRELNRELARQEDEHADEMSDLNWYVLGADQRATEQTNRHAEEVAGLFAQIDEARAETRDEHSKRLDAENDVIAADRIIARQDTRIARLLARVAALKAAR